MMEVCVLNWSDLDYIFAHLRTFSRLDITLSSFFTQSSNFDFLDLLLISELGVFRPLT